MTTSTWTNRRLLSATALVAVASIVAYTDWSFGFVPVGSMLFDFLALGAALPLVFGVLLRRPRVITMSLYLALASAIGHVVGPFIMAEQEMATRNRGDVIASALSDYFAVHDQYPTNLAKLFAATPSLQQNSAMGLVRRVPFDYRRRNGSYQLWFPVFGFGYCKRSAKEQWFCDR